MTFLSYAQNAEDVVLWRALGTVNDGFYIDVGAQHPSTDSVTKAFYERGWSGINVEPNPHYFELLGKERSRDRTLQLALGAARGTARFFVVDHSGMSTLDARIARVHRRSGWSTREIQVEVVTFDDLCREWVRGEVHFLKIDVEGREGEVLRGAALAEHRPWMIVVEAVRPTTQEPSWSDWEPLLLGRGYRLALFDGLNRFYVADEHPELLAKAAVPASCLDRFERYEQYALRANLVARDAKIGRLEVLLQDAAREVARLSDALQRPAASGADGVRAPAEAIRNALERALAAASAGSDAPELEAQLAADIPALRAALQSTQQLLRQSAEELEAVYASRSWRVTAPLRRLSDALRSRGARR